MSAAAFGLYLLTCAPGVLWGDSGTYQVRVARGPFESPLGLALTHPLYLLLARGFAMLPIGEIAYRVNLFSAVCAALTVGLIFVLLCRLTRSFTGPLVGCVLLAVSHTFWTHAVMAEVYALYALALAGELCLMERHFSTRRNHWLHAAMLLNGLNTCNHLLALLHLPAYGIYLITRAFARDPVGANPGGHAPAPRPTAAGRALWLTWQILYCAVVWACGASMYIGMVAAQAAARDDTWSVVRESLTGRAYGMQMGGKAFSLFDQLVRTAQCFALNFPTPLLGLAAIAIASALRRRPREHLPTAAQVAESSTATTDTGVSTKGANVIRFALGILAVNSAFGLAYRVPDQYVFFFPSYVIVALLVGIGASRYAGPRAKRWTVAALLALGILPAVVYEAAPSICRQYQIGLRHKRQLAARDEYAYFLRPRKNGEESARRFCELALHTAGAGAYLLADSTIKSPLVYVRDVAGVGRDVVLESAWFSEVSPAPPIAAKSPDVLRAFVDGNGAYVCDVTPGYFDPSLANDYVFVRQDGIWRLARR